MAAIFFHQARLLRSGQVWVLERSGEIGSFGGMKCSDGGQSGMSECGSEKEPESSNPALLGPKLLGTIIIDS